MEFEGWGLGLGPKAPSRGALLLQGAPQQKPNSIQKPTTGARKKGAKHPEFLV